MSTSDRGFFAPLSHDIRVRERLLAAGVITPAEIQQYLAELPDHESQCETLGIGQPALNTPQPPAPPPAPAPIRVSAPVFTSSSASRQIVDDDDDDEEDDEDDDDFQAADGKSDDASAGAADQEAAPAQTIAVGEPNPNGSDSNEAVEARKDAEAAAVEVAQADGAADDAPAGEATNEDAAKSTEEQAG